MAVWENERDTFADAAVADLAKIEPSLGQARGLTVASALRTYTVTVDSRAGGTYSIERAPTATSCAPARSRAWVPAREHRRRAGQPLVNTRRVVDPIRAQPRRRSGR